MSTFRVGPRETQLECPFCHAIVMSRVVHKSTSMTHVMAILLCVFLCWPCAWVPYYVGSCQNTEHYCPSCNAYLDTYVG